MIGPGALSRAILRGVALLFLCFLLASAPASAQATDADILPAVQAVYAGISANEGEARDWRGFAALFLPDARLVNVGRGAEGVWVQNTSVAEWVVESGLGLEGRGFVEDIVHSQVDAYGPIAQVFTTWVTRSERGGAERRHGAATLQLVQTTEGWRVASWIWTGEVEGQELPPGAAGVVGRDSGAGVSVDPDVPPEFGAVLRSYEAAWAQRDEDALANLFTEDGFVLRPERPLVQGRDAIRRAYANAGGPLVLKPYGHAISDSAGYMVGGFSSESDQADAGKFVLALRKVSGRWLIAADIDNGNGG